MARLQIEKQIAFIIAKFEVECPNEVERHLSSPLNKSKHSKIAICKHFYPLLANGRNYDSFCGSFLGQITGVKKAIQGDTHWTQGGIDALGYLLKANLEELGQFYSTMAELAMSISRDNE